MAHFNRDMAKSFLESLFQKCEDGYLELRPINEKGSRPKFFPVSEGFTPALDYIEQLVGEYHIFFGIQPRGKESGRDEDIETLIAFWADIDAKDFGGSKEKARESLNNFPLEPTLLVDSGNGYHAYWVLEEPWKLRSKTDREEAANISKIIHKTVGGDNTANLSRILRLPGTPNIKDPNAETTPNTTSNQSLWTECKIVNNSYTLYQLVTIKNNLPDDIEVDAEPLPVNFDQRSRIHSLADLKKYVSDKKVLDRAQNMPAKYEDDRSANDFWVAVKLYEAGLNDAEVYDAFRLFKNHDWDAGQKFREKGRVYLEKTLSAAKGEAVNLRLPQIIERVRNANGIDEKLEAAKPAYAILSYMDSAKQEAKINELQEAFGGNRVMKKSTITRLIKEEQAKTGPGRFFEVTSSGSLKFVPKKLGDYLLDRYNFLNVESYLYYYEDGVFKDRAEQRFLHNEIIKLLSETWRESYRDEVVAYIKDKTFIEADALPLNVGIINVRNGMYDIINDKLLPHSPDYMSLAQLDVEYNPNAECPRLEQFVQEVFPADTIPLVWEHAGYILLSGLELKKFAVFVGEGNNGKSVWCNIIEAVVGPENCAHQSIQDLSESKNARAELFGKLVNIYADLPSEAIADTGTLKMLTGGDKLSAEKKYKDPFSFTNRARLIFSANQLPAVTDYNEAFFERVHIIECPNQFEDDDADPFLVEKLTTEEAKSAWLNKAIEGAKRLLENKKFTESETVKKAVQTYRFASDSVSEFIHTQLVREEGAFETRDTVYAAYKNWCKQNGRQAVSEHKFTRRAKSKPNGLELYYPKVNGEQRHAWRNVRLTDISRKRYVSEDFSVNVR